MPKRGTTAADSGSKTPPKKQIKGSGIELICGDRQAKGHESLSYIKRAAVEELPL